MPELCKGKPEVLTCRHGSRFVPNVQRFGQDERYSLRKGNGGADEIISAVGHCKGKKKGGYNSNIRVLMLRSARVITATTTEGHASVAHALPFSVSRL
mmetsp:Transcript_75523/g.133399  ORF Transcript_75523/g.133399 Transcript_75523/m.133399 type:complete len:98 (+) Transcript_75523:437-730(+)